MRYNISATLCALVECLGLRCMGQGGWIRLFAADAKEKSGACGKTG